MAKIKKNTDTFSRIKTQVDTVLDAQNENVERYWHSRNFVYKSAMDDDEIQAANESDRPTLESNILEPYISRMVGEIAKQLPDPRVEPKIPGDPTFASQAEVVENHIRHIFDKARDVRIECYENTLSGGFYVFKVCTDYIRDDKFEQGIFIKRVQDITSCGFDPLAQESSKFDGQFCFEMIEKTREDFEKEYPKAKSDASFWLKNNRNWFYHVGGSKEKEVLTICNYYEKDYEYKTMVWVSDPLNQDRLISMYKEDYEEKKKILLNQGLIDIEMPKIVKEEIRKICRILNYELNGEQILSVKKTDYKYFPLIYCDGNSKKLKNKTVIRSLVYQAMDAQKAKNMTFQSILNEIENRGTTDEYLPKAGLPEEDEFKEPWMSPRKKHAAKFYNHVDSQGNPINPPTKIPQAPLDGSLIQFYELMNSACQQSLGSYDAQQGLQRDMSGIAIQNGAMQSNNAAMPYVIKYLEAWTQAARVCVDLMPKYMTTLMSIPVIDREGKASYQLINNTKSNPMYKLEYEEDDMDVTVSMDLSFEMQKQVALQNIETAMKMSPEAQQFFGGPGFHFVLDNMSFRDIAKVKEEYAQYQQQKQANAQQAQQMAMATNPVVAQTRIEEGKRESEDKDRKLELIKTVSDIKLQERKIEAEESKTQANILESRDKLIIAALAASAENKRSHVEAAIALDKHAYEKLESERSHALKVNESKMSHILDIVKTARDG